MPAETDFNRYAWSEGYECSGISLYWRLRNRRENAWQYYTVRFVPGEVNFSPRIKAPPPLSRSRDSLPSAAIFESKYGCELRGGKISLLRGKISLPGEM